jgi:hypothetical protein
VILIGTGFEKCHGWFFACMSSRNFRRKYSRRHSPGFDAGFSDDLTGDGVVAGTSATGGAASSGTGGAASLSGAGTGASASGAVATAGVTAGVGVASAVGVFTFGSRAGKVFSSSRLSSSTLARGSPKIHRLRDVVCRATSAAI